MQKQKKIEIVPPPSVGTEDERSQIITTTALLDCDKISSLCLIVVQLLLFYPDLSERVMVRWRWEICLLFRPNIYPAADAEANAKVQRTIRSVSPGL